MKLKKFLGIMLATGLIFNSIEISLTNSFAEEIKVDTENNEEKPLASYIYTYAVEGGNIYFNAATGEIIDCDTSAISVDIPQEINGVEVTGIGYGAFSNCTNLTSINMYWPIADIKEQAFLNCTSLTSVTLPAEALEKYEDNFYEENFFGGFYVAPWGLDSCTSLSSIRVEDPFFNYDNIDGALYNRDATRLIYCPKGKASIDIPDSVSEIERNAFNNCSKLKSIKISNRVTNIERYMFWGCSSLTDINVAKDNPNYSSVDGVLYNKETTELIYCPKGKASIIIPNSVYTIEREAFSDCGNLKSIIVTEDNSNYSFVDGVLYNKDKTWLIYCPMGKTSINIYDSIYGISDYAFSNCSTLLDINVSENNSNYSSVDGVLYNKDKTELICCPKGKTSINIPDSISEIKSSMFCGCSNLKNISIPDSITTIRLCQVGTQHF